MADVHIRPANGKTELKRFIECTRYIYRDDPNWIQPLLLERLDALSPSKNPFFEHADVQLWTAERDGRAVGRISAQIDTLAQEKWGPHLAHFGFFEAEDKATADALIATAKSWAQERGMKRIQGPWSLSANMEAGTLVDGFDTPPVAMMPHGRLEYADWLADNGFRGVKDMWAYEIDLHEGFSEKTHRIVAAARRNKRITMRQLDKSNYEADIATILDIFNDGWAERWGYVPFTEAEGKHMAAELKPIIKPHRTVICEYDGEPAAFMITIPDIYHAIRDLGGRLLPFGIFKLIKRLLLSHPTRCRVPLMGVRQKFQRSPSGAAMAIWMISDSRDEVVKRGATFGEVGWILDDNEGMNKILIDIGCNRYKTYRIFEANL